MAVEPLFNADKPTLVSRLRLSGSAQPDGLAQIDKAIEDVRLGFFGALGEPRVVEILAVAFAENALTAASLVRTQANNIEVTWVRMLLMRRLPMLFMDSSGETLEAWNEEPIQRLSGRDLRDELKRLQDEIDKGLEDIGADPDATGNLHAEALGADDPFAPRYSIQPINWGS